MAFGRRKIDPINPVTVSKVRVRVAKSVGTPLVRKFQVHAGKVKPDSTKTAVAVTGSSEHPSKSFTARYAMDGNPATHWVSADVTDKTPTLEYDLRHPETPAVDLG